MRFEEKSTKIYIPKITNVFGCLIRREMNRKTHSNFQILQSKQLGHFFRLKSCNISISQKSYLFAAFYHVSLFLLVIYCVRKFFSNLRESKISFTNNWKRFVYRHGSMFIFSVKTFLKITHRRRKWTKVESLKNRKRKATKEINWFWGTICD